MFQNGFARSVGFLWATFVGFLAIEGRVFAEARPSFPIETRQFIQKYCSECHNDREKSGGITFDQALDQTIDAQSSLWEKGVKRLRGRQMPPREVTRPSEAEYEAALQSLTAELDSAYWRNPLPGRTESLRRLTRMEYRNAIRDLLGVAVDVQALLPADESSHGFDNITVGELSPLLLNRYVTAAQKISRLAIGGPRTASMGETIRIRPDITQEEHVEGLPLGTRGGALIPITFPSQGEYQIQVRLARDRNEEVEGLTEPHDVEFLLDRRHVATLKVKPPSGREGHELVDTHLKVRLRSSAGLHQVGVTFAKRSSSLLETKRQPYQAHYNKHRHPRITPAVYEISITGPLGTGVVNDTLTRRKVFSVYPSTDREEEQTACAEAIFGKLMRCAYRRPIEIDDMRQPMAFYRNARLEGGDFETGVEMGLNSILINPHFLFRIEAEPSGVSPGTAYRVSDIELASRLSFFLWSSLPDEELLRLAESGDLRRDEILEQQVRRLLADPRSASLIENFVDQWLYLRNLDSFTPDLRLFPDFDDNLRQAFRQETELFVGNIIAEDRSVLEMLHANHTFLNERLAKHYGIPHVYGSRFRRVELDEDSHRGGLLRHGSILTVTSYATRTSPVIRGHWILKNLMGMAPPPPPANVPALKDNTISSELSVRQRLSEHRANAACASCHDLMDPVGFCLENYDPIGRWRAFESGQAIDVTGNFPDGTPLNGVESLEEGLLAHPELFVGTLVEKLLTFATGRGIEDFDAPAIRSIVNQAQADRYRVSSILIEIAKSPPLQMRASP